MMALSVAYQQERPNVEAAGLTSLVIRALGMILGKMVRDDGGVGGVGGVGGIGGIGGVLTKRYFIPTQSITMASQMLIEVLEVDINSEFVTSRRVGRVLQKMRLVSAKQPRGGKRGWMISIDDLNR